MSDISPDLSGRTLGNWTLVRMLGEGGFGAVYEAQHTTITGRRAAVKVLHPHLSFHKDIKRRFTTEASIASQAEHENIVQVFDGGVSTDGICYVAMELLKGRSLAKYIHDEGKLDVNLTLKVALQVASALETAHGLGVVHRDLKPDNIFVTPRKTNPHLIKVLDFGIAKLHTQDSKTATGTLLGTPLYMSPEQWQTLPDIDGRSDLYSLGVILFECLTGKPPFDGATSFILMMAHIQKEIPEFPPELEIPQPLIALIRRLMAKKREDRPATAKEVHEELLKLAGQRHEESSFAVEKTPAVGSQPSPYVSPRSLSIRQQSGELMAAPGAHARARTRLILSVGGGAAALGGAALSWLLLHPRPVQPVQPVQAKSEITAPAAAAPQPPAAREEAPDMKPAEAAAAPAPTRPVHPAGAAAHSRRGDGKAAAVKSAPAGAKPKPDAKAEHDLYVVPIIR